VTISSLHAEAVPSQRKAFLQRLEGAVVTELTRYSWWPPDEATAKLRIPPSSVFSLTAGPLLATFDSGLILGLGSQPSLISVTIWLEEEAGGSRGGDPITDDRELHPIDATDPIYSSETFREMIRRRVLSMTIIKRRAARASWTALPREVGLVLHFDNGTELIASHGLHDDSDDFSVIIRNQISAKLEGQLDEFSLTNLPGEAELG
jgi:hypothetical protein